MTRGKRGEDTLDQRDLAEIGKSLKGVGVHNNYENVKVAINKHQKGPGKSSGYSNPKRLEVMLRQAKALELRRAGFSYREIAERPELPYKGNVRRVGEDLQKILQDVIDVPAKEVLALEISRLDAMTQVLWKDVRQGDLSAMDRMLRLMRHRQDLLGLAAPVKHEVVSKSHFDAEVETLTAELARMAEGNDDLPADIEGVPPAESYAASKAMLELQNQDSVKDVKIKRGR